MISFHINNFDIHTSFFKSAALCVYIWRRTIISTDTNDLDYSPSIAERGFFARANGLTEFVSIQGHYNLIAREEEREMVPFCVSEDIAMTPYSALAGGRLSRRPGETSKRLTEDSYAKFKYDATAKQDGFIIQRVAELADRRGVSMTEIALAWLLTKVASPVVGATKISHVDGAVKAVDLELSEDEIIYLEDLYVPHALVGVLAQNGKQKAGNVV